jgi:3-methyladenine DNA glycosylase Tag
MEILSEQNFDYFAKLKYNNPGCNSIEEFNDDVKRIKYVRRLFQKYDEEKTLKHHLISNHILILINLFGEEATLRMLFFKIEKKYHGFIKAFVNYLGLKVQKIPEIDLSLLAPDARITRILNKVEKQKND